jgi:outer membrane protein assembly factor BamB
VKRALLGLLALAGCDRPLPRHADAMSAIDREDPGEDRLSYKWKFVTSDRRTEIAPQEFAAAAIDANTGMLFIGSAEGTFYALDEDTGHLIWKKHIGAMSCAPLISGGVLYVGTSDGQLVALDAQTGKPKWPKSYIARGPIEQTPSTTGDLIVFADEADQVVAIDAITGQFKWQYKSETPEEYTLRGHAGVRVDDQLLYTGFSNGTLVALRKDTGSVAWSTSLKADADRFMDVDATPIVIKDTLYASSASGGVYAVDKATGLVRWRTPFYDVSQPSSTGNVGGLTTDGKLLYASVADLGTYAIDLAGNIVWRVGAKGGGEPGSPIVFEDLLIYTLAEDGMFLAERRTGATVEYFDPGDGVSAQPTVTADGRLFVMSNRGILYAFDLDDDAGPTDRVREWFHGVF